MMDYEAMGRRIRRKRQEKGLTQQQFSAKLNLSTSFYGHIERGTRAPSIDTLVLIANELHTGLDVLLRDSLTTPFQNDRNSIFTPQNIRILRTYLDEQQSALDHWIDGNCCEDNDVLIEENDEIGEE